MTSREIRSLLVRAVAVCGLSYVVSVVVLAVISRDVDFGMTSREIIGWLIVAFNAWVAFRAWRRGQTDQALLSGGVTLMVLGTVLVDGVEVVGIVVGAFGMVVAGCGVYLNHRTWWRARHPGSDQPT